MKDFLGNELAINDPVIITTPGYASITLGTVVAFTPKKVRIKYRNNWNYIVNPVDKEILVDPDTVCIVCKVEINDATKKTYLGK